MRASPRGRLKGSTLGEFTAQELAAHKFDNRLNHKYIYCLSLDKYLSCVSLATRVASALSSAGVDGSSSPPVKVDARGMERTPVRYGVVRIYHSRSERERPKWLLTFGSTIPTPYFPCLQWPATGSSNLSQTTLGQRQRSFPPVDRFTAASVFPFASKFWRLQLESVSVNQSVEITYFQGRVVVFRPVCFPSDESTNENHRYLSNFILNTLQTE